MPWASQIFSKCRKMADFVPLTEALDRLAADEGLSRAEVIRRLLDRALAGADDDAQRYLAAIEASFGVLADVEGEFVELDRDDGERGRHLSRIWSTGT